GEVRPRSSAIVTGKNVRYEATITIPTRPLPKAKAMSGARARIGIVWLATTYGMNARSASFEWTKTAASPRPTSAPATNPGPAARPVKIAAPARTPASDCSWSRGTGAASAPAMLQTGGSDRSLAIDHENGGV